MAEKSTQRQTESTDTDRDDTTRADTAESASSDGGLSAVEHGPGLGRATTVRSDTQAQPSVRRRRGHSGQRPTGQGAHVPYDTGPDPAALSARYEMSVHSGEATRLQRLESEHGSGQVRRWADEGMPVDTMGKPRDMQAFRERQADRSAAIPTDIERRNQASVRRNAARNQDDGPAGTTTAPDTVRRVVSSPGRSMNESVQREMESKMGGDFSDVQVHTGPKAAAAADSINARAFTVGNHVAFNRGEYQPGSDDGKRVLAHELTHVRQQTGGRVSLLPKADAEGSGPRAVGVHVQPKLEVSSPDDPAEREARAVAEQVVQTGGQTAQQPSKAGTDTVSASDRPVRTAGTPADATGDTDVERARTQSVGRSPAVTRQVQRQTEGEGDPGQIVESSNRVGIEIGSSVNTQHYTATVNAPSGETGYVPLQKAGDLSALNIHRSVVFIEGWEMAVVDNQSGNAVHAKGEEEYNALFQELVNATAGAGYPKAYIANHLASKLQSGESFHVAYELLVWQETRGVGSDVSSGGGTKPEGATPQQATFPGVSRLGAGNKFLFFTTASGFNPPVAMALYALHRAAMHGKCSIAVGLDAGLAGGQEISFGAGYVFLPNGDVGVYGSVSEDFGAQLSIGIDVAFTVVFGGIDTVTGMVTTVSAGVHLFGGLTGTLILEYQGRRSDGSPIAGEYLGSSAEVGLGYGADFLTAGTEGTGIL